MAGDGAILGWRIDKVERAALLMRFPPRYPQVVAEHVTHGRQERAPPLPCVTGATIIGWASDDAGVEALVVELGGTSARWDGSTYHITWSLAPGRAARESNDVIAGHGWSPVADRPRVTLIPASWR